jgi:RNA polymerase sigma-32 factor
MSREEPVDLDPEVLADPLGDEEADSEQVSADAAADDALSPEKSEPAALVPVSRGALAPFDPFRRYKAEISKYPPLDREEEQALARRYRDTGDREALFRLITANLMLVVRIALSFRRAARNLLDLIQEGNIGLLQAIERFDPEVGVRLPTYAAWWIRAYMVKFLLDNVRLVRVGTTNARRKLVRNLRREKQKLQDQGFEVGPKLLADHFGVSEEDVRDVQAALDSHDVSLDAPVAADDDRDRSESFADSTSAGVEEQVARRELQERTEAALKRFRRDLGERELALLDDRILSETPLTLQALGDRFGTTREAVRQAEARLMKRLRTFLRDELGDLGQVRVGPD